MKITRKFTVAGRDPFGSVKWVTRSSKITNPDGSVVFEMKDAEVPESWSQLATDIMVSKYFRKAGVPQDGGPRGIASPGYEAGGERQQVSTGPERSARQVIHRLAGCWRHWGEEHGYFDTGDDAQAFYDEIVHMLVHQMAAPNSPQWFNTGLAWAYGITGPAQGHFIAEHATGEVRLAGDAYTHPQPHACFIQSVEDDLVNPGGIMDLWVREARLFKYGSGTGTNFSRLRGENESLSGGGKSSGLMSWLRIGDRAAGAIKSGGTTRRAAKMVCLDLDHPDIEAFVNWKVREEIKVAAMVEGMRHLSADQRKDAQRLGLSLDYDFNGESYYTVSGQNSNNSVRVPDEFFDVLDQGGEWRTYFRTSGKLARTIKADDLWDQIGYAAWRCADPGVQYDTTINAWHTCPGAGRINASNPCSEYMFLDNTACNLASLNALKFYSANERLFDIEGFEHAVDLWTIVLEVSVLMAAFPSAEIAKLSWTYRTLGLGYANLGAMLMQAGIAYDSVEARAVCACVSAILTGRSYRQSARMAGELGAFGGYAAERENMLRVIRNHRLAAHGVGRESEEYSGLRVRPVQIDHDLVRSGRVRIANAMSLLDHAVRAWDDALELGVRHGYRNAQTTVIAPTGTIGLLMDCDTTGIEPDFALVKFKKLAGGGYFKIANASVRPALEALGYSDRQVRDILVYLLGTLNVDVALPWNPAVTLRSLLMSRGMSQADLERVNESLPGVLELSYAFSGWALADETLAGLSIDPAAARADGSWNLLTHFGLSRDQIEQLNELVCGRQTVEGAPHLREEDLSVFDCASTCGKTGVRFIAPEGHIRMMASAQPFISGAISKTINLPSTSTVADVKSAYRLSWELGLKANALYRDGCKLSQPLSTSVEKKEEASAGPAGGGGMIEGKAVAGSGGVMNAPGVAGIEAVLLASDEDEERMEELSPIESVLAEAQVRIVERPMRRRLPDTRASITHKFNIGGHEGYLTVGLYEDGLPGELFITMAKEGSTIGGLMDCLGTAVSVALQYGVPVESLVNKFTHQRFEPAGMTTNREIPFAKSLVDYIFRWMGIQFIPGYREANTPRREGEAESIGPAEATAIAASTPGGVAGSNRMTGGTGGNGNGEGGGGGGRMAMAIEATRVTAVVSGTGAAGLASTLDAYMDRVGDAPACDVCGTITVRSGTCYKCLNCGQSMGCS